MEKLIIIYCCSIGFVLCCLAAFLLFYDDKKEDLHTAGTADNIMLAGALLIGSLILHMNLLVLPWHQNEKAALTSFTMLAGFIGLLPVSWFAIYLIRRTGKRTALPHHHKRTNGSPLRVSWKSQWEHTPQQQGSAVK